MKIVIDIDNDTYNNIVKDFPEMFWSYNIRRSIKNGIIQHPDYPACVLEKIRAEIENVKNNPLFNMVSNNVIHEVILEIIEEHMESEDKQ